MSSAYHNIITGLTAGLGALGGGIGAHIATATDEDLSGTEKTLAKLVGALGAGGLAALVARRYVPKSIGEFVADKERAIFRGIGAPLLGFFGGSSFGQGIGEIPLTIRGIKSNDPWQEKKSAVEVSNVEPFFMRPVSAMSPMSTIGEPLLAEVISPEVAYNRFRAGRAPRYAHDMAKILGDEADMQGRPLHVNVGSGRPLKGLWRLWNNSNLSIPEKAVLSLASPISDFMAGWTRADHYNPSTHTVTVYHDSPSVLAHELGHAVDFARRSKSSFQKALNPNKKHIPYEVRATLIGEHLLQKLRERRYADTGTKFHAVAGKQQARKSLRNALGTYVAAEYYDEAPMTADPFMPENEAHSQATTLLNKGDTRAKSINRLIDRLVKQQDKEEATKKKPGGYKKLPEKKSAFALGVEKVAFNWAKPIKSLTTMGRWALRGARKANPESFLANQYIRDIAQGTNRGATVLDNLPGSHRIGILGGLGGLMMADDDASLLQRGLMGVGGAALGYHGARKLPKLWAQELPVSATIGGGI